MKNPGTHEHFAGEFRALGRRKITSKLAKDPAYRAARAEYFAREAQHAQMMHASAIGHTDKAAHALMVAHAMKRSRVHANAAQRLAPGSEYASRANVAHGITKLAHDSLTKTEPPITSTETRTNAAKKATKDAFAKTKIASQSPTVKTQTDAATAHAKAATANQGDAKTVALHEKQAQHHRHRAETILLDGAHSDEHLAEIVHAHIAKVGPEGMFGDRKVFTHEIYDKMNTSDKQKFGSLSQFKDKLRDLHKKQLVTLARADLVAAMNPTQVSKSHMNIENVGHHEHKTGVPSANFVIKKDVK